jgi:hypothetical protein
MDQVISPEKKALLHCIAWAIQNIYSINKEALAIIDNKEMEEKEKILLLQGQNGTDYRMLNLILMLKPSIEFVKEYYPDQQQFVEWFEDKWKYIEEKKLIQENCNCKGCKVEEPKE